MAGDWPLSSALNVETDTCVTDCQCTCNEKCATCNCKTVYDFNIDFILVWTLRLRSTDRKVIQFIIYYVTPLNKRKNLQVFCFLKFVRRYLGYMTRQYANLFLKAAGLFPNVCKRGLDVISFSQAAKAEVGSLDIRAIVKVQFAIGWIGSLRCWLRKPIERELDFCGVA